MPRQSLAGKLLQGDWVIGSLGESMGFVAESPVFWRLRIALGLLLLGCFLVGSLFRSMGWFIHDIYWLQEDLGGDKATHFLMGASFVLAAWLIWPARWLRWRLSGGLVAAVLLLAVDELAQGFSSTREFALSDLAMGVLGAVGAFGVAGLVGMVFEYLPTKR